MNVINEINEHINARVFDGDLIVEVDVPATIEMAGRESEWTFRVCLTSDGVKLPDREKQLDAFREHIQNVIIDLLED